MLGFARGTATNVQPLFASSGAFVSVLMVLQIVPYFMTGFESIPKASEEARPDLPAGTLSRMIIVAIGAGGLFYVLVIAVVAWVYPWTDIVSQHLGTEAAFARAFGTPWIARLILAGALTDFYGRKRMFIFGLIGFGATSVLCGLAPNMELLVLFRIFQGAAGALLKKSGSAPIFLGRGDKFGPLGGVE